MTKTIILTITIAFLCACSHKELKAPCTNIATLSSDSIPCDQRIPVNTTPVSSLFAQ